MPGAWTSPTAVVAEISEKRYRASRSGQSWHKTSAALWTPLIANYFKAVVDFMGSLGQQKQATDDKYHIPAGDLLGEDAKPGFQRADIQGDKSKASRESVAKPSPRDRARLRCACGNLPSQDGYKNDIVDARTIFRASKVVSATQDSGRKIQSNMVLSP
ncbi:MAG: hypothetical protein U5R30_20595 [Deltaproteobacteria bacterium]|nr:hypothetical protein [Deltaproteobacteria bacterium]